MSNNVELVQDTKARELNAKIRTFKQMHSLFKKRLESWREAELLCASWNDRYAEGGRDECKVFINYLETRIKRLEKQQNKKKRRLI